MTGHERAPVISMHEVMDRMKRDPRAINPNVLREYNWRYGLFHPEPTIHNLVWVKEDVRAIDKNSTGVVIAFIGPSAAGKDSILSIMKKELNIMQIRTTTTRPKRKGQSNLEESYDFITKEKFDEMNGLGLFIETIPLGNNFSGTTKKAVQDALASQGLVVWRGEPNGLRKLWSWLDRKIQRRVVFLMPNMPIGDYINRIRTMRNKEDPDRRIKAALNELHLEGNKADYIVLNPPNSNGPVEATEAMYKLFTYLGATPK